MANIAKPTNLNIIWAAGGTKIDPGVTKTNIGWVVQLPPYEYQNWAMNRSDTAIAHFNQHGIPEWDVNTEYQGNLSYSQGSNGLIYKCIQTHIGLDPTNTNNNLYWVRAFEEYGSVATVQSQLNAHLANYATLSGISNIVLARANLSVYSKAEGDARYAFKGGDNATPFLVGTASNANHAIPLGQLSSLVVAATESTAGITRYASAVETEAGTVDNRSITPLKASNTFLKKSGNLAGLTNIPLARTNLGLSATSFADPAVFLYRADNLLGLTNIAAARANLGLGTAATSNVGQFLQTANNLGEFFGNAATARANLGLSDSGLYPSDTWLVRVNNLGDLPNPAQARINLGLSDSGLYPSNTWLIRTSNLGDLTNVQTARNNLGLGNLATANAYGILGPDIVFQNNWDAQGGATVLPNFVKMQWGSVVVGQTITFRYPFTQSYSVTLTHGPNALGSPGSGITGKNNNGFTLGYGTGGYMWIAIGV